MIPGAKTQSFDFRLFPYPSGFLTALRIKPQTRASPHKIWPPAYVYVSHLLPSPSLATPNSPAFPPLQSRAFFLFLEEIKFISISWLSNCCSLCQKCSFPAYSDGWLLLVTHLTWHFSEGLSLATVCKLASPPTLSSFSLTILSDFYSHLSSSHFLFFIGDF